MHASSAPRRILYALGPGDAVSAYRAWKQGRDLPSETSVTFSSQFFEYCRQTGTRGFAISSHPRSETVEDELLRVENRPKRLANRGGVLYHLSQLLYAATIVSAALRRRADAVIVDSGTTHWFLLTPLTLARIPVVASLHNVLWPPGFAPSDRARRLLLRLDGWFFRRCADATVCVSPECERQVRAVAGQPKGPLFQYRALFQPSLFASVTEPPPHGERPFRILFAGRVERSKGVFDVATMAERLDSPPSGFEWRVCGDGSAAAELARHVRARGLESTVRMMGKLDQRALRSQYEWAHLVIVPTRSDFCEGLAMASAEAVLAGRPVLSSAVNPAVDVLGDAVVPARPDDVDSYVAAIRRLAGDRAEYERRVAACGQVRQQFLDAENGLRAALSRAIASLGGTDLTSPAGRHR